MGRNDQPVISYGIAVGVARAVGNPALLTLELAKLRLTSIRRVDQGNALIVALTTDSYWLTVAGSYLDHHPGDECDRKVGVCDQASMVGSRCILCAGNHFAGDASVLMQG
ncbi:hypothetical protein EMCG_06939 [[Emmonsia] crescens]|uniref:Uncharacterized protein n=1 Tax=[Emmonsia] crescens TaxID=73230 RepID=A0A0G2JBF9_9EURO|nr:hypothetical protein EMCG_06939 [Emmonsia crescens UAMH 3008]